jgi:hypothetical protein
MDSLERDLRAKEGFGERGEILYDADERDEKRTYRSRKLTRRKLKDHHVTSADILNSNEYGLDDEEAEDIEEVPDEDESHSNERGLDDEG